jgi:biopolymer transport protein ExbD
MWMPFNWDETPDLNITPLVDIMLVLLAILMVTAPVVVYEESISLPKGSSSKQLEEHSKIEVRIDAQKNIYIQNDRFDFLEFPDRFLLFSRKFDKKTPVYLRADKNLKYQDVVFILAGVKESGFLRVSLVTDG